MSSGENLPVLDEDKRFFGISMAEFEAEAAIEYAEAKERLVNQLSMSCRNLDNDQLEQLVKVSESMRRANLSNG